jgi:hypothetical protein
VGAGVGEGRGRAVMGGAGCVVIAGDCVDHGVGADAGAGAGASAGVAHDARTISVLMNTTAPNRSALPQFTKPSRFAGPWTLTTVPFDQCFNNRWSTRLWTRLRYLSRCINLHLRVPNQHKLCNISSSYEPRRLICLKRPKIRRMCNAYS